MKRMSHFSVLLRHAVEVFDLMPIPMVVYFDYVVSNISKGNLPCMVLLEFHVHKLDGEKSLTSVSCA